MKKLIFTLIAAIAFQFCFSQTNYYWVAGAGTATSFTSLSNWNSVKGSTAAATKPTVVDGTNTFIIDGTDLGGGVTGALLITGTGTITVGQLFIKGNADVSFSRSSTGGTTTITVAGLASGDYGNSDFYVDAGSKLTFTGTTGSFFLPIGASATGEVLGTIEFLQGTSTVNNRMSVATKNALQIQSTGTVITRSTYATYPFNGRGSSTLPAQNGVVFNAGSSFIFEGGSSPFGNNFSSPSTEMGKLIQLKPGSKFYFKAAGNTNMFYDRTYGDVYIQNNTTVTVDSAMIADNITIETGSTLAVNSTATINGTINNNGTLSGTGRVNFSGSSAQYIQGTGAYNFTDIIVSNPSNVTLQKSISATGNLRVIGTMNATGYTISGSPTITKKSPATVTVTGSVNIDSILVKNVSSLTGIEVGMSVTGTDIQANTVVTNVNSTDNSISLSKPLITGTTTYASAAQSLTISNGQGVLPVKFTSFKGALDGSKVKLTWDVATEDNIANYIIERSANGKEFTSIGSVKAANLNSYNTIDQQPIKGVNFYRIKAVDNDARTTYSSIVKISTSNTKAEISINPNPVIGKNFMLNLNNVANDIYTVTLINGGGQKIYAQSLGRINGSANTSINLPQSIKPGMYSVVISSNDQQIIQRIIIQ